MLSIHAHVSSWHIASIRTRALNQWNPMLIDDAKALLNWRKRNIQGE
jgi:hypothetical protein